MFTLTCHVQKYAWGKRGNESLVASLLKLVLDIADPYFLYRLLSEQPTLISA